MRALAALSLVLVACSPTIKEGWYACTGEGTCPSGWRCIRARCYSTSYDAGAPECRIDLHCDDGDPCTLDVCDSGYCSHDPQPGPCDDGNFCDGLDMCNAGHCVNVGPPPCPGQCDGTSCMGCGHVAEPCCLGTVCSQGRCNPPTMTCETCGDGPGAPCCLDACNTPDLSCVMGTCQACGGDSQPCCPGALCNGGRMCDLTGTCVTPTGCGAMGCPPDTVCVDTSCQPCGATSQPCCATMPRCTPGICDNGSGLCMEPPCGMPSAPCCPGNVCGAFGYACTPSAFPGGISTCEPCGEVTQECCGPPSMVPCNGSAVCGMDGTCTPCGSDSQPCCPADPCPGGSGAALACVDGTCRSDCGGFTQACCGSSSSCAPPYHCNAGLCM